MAIELERDTQAAAIRSIERWHLEETGEPIGNVRAAALLRFFLAEIAPSVYNRAVADVQQRLLVRVGEIDIDCHEDEFGHWTAARKPR